MDIVNVVKISFKEGVSIETRLGDNIGGGRSGSIHDNNDNNKEVEIYADKSRATRAISYIVDNAKYTDSGAIRIESLVSVDNKRLEIQVTDSGNGIAKDILPNLFGRFVTRTFGNENKRATGLGVYIAKSIVYAHSGYNNKQAGRATITIVLPPHVNDENS